MSTPTTPPPPPQTPQTPTPPTPAPPAPGTPQPPVKKKKNSALPWILGGVALLVVVGVVALALIIFAGWKISEKYDENREKIEEISHSIDDDGEFSADGMFDEHAYNPSVDELPDEVDVVDEYPVDMYEEGVVDVSFPSWYASLSPGMYRLNAILFDPAKPEKKYRCHVDFRFNGEGQPLSDCKYYNDSYGGEFNVTPGYNEEHLAFSGREGSNEFDISTTWGGGNSFVGTSSYGSTTIHCTATLTRL